MQKGPVRQKFSRYFPFFILACGIVAFAILFAHLLSLSGTIWQGLRRLLGVLSPVFVGMIIAFFLIPAVSKAESWLRALQRFLRRQKEIHLPGRCKAPAKEHKLLIRGFSMLLCYACIFGAVAAAIIFVIPQVLSSLTVIVNLASSSVARLVEFASDLLKNWENLPLNDYVSVDDILDILNSQLSNITTLLQNFITNIVPEVYGMISSFAGGFINFMIGVVFSVYLIFDHERVILLLKRLAYTVFRKKDAMILINLCSEAVSIFRTFFLGKIIDSVIIGLICYVLMLILRLDYPILISVIVGVTNVIPCFGPYLGAVPSALILLMSSPMQMFVFIIMIVILQAFDGNILGPYILGGRLGIKPFWIVFSVTVGGGLFGLKGMIIGVPLFTVIYTLLCRIFSYLRERKNIADPQALDTLEQERLNYMHPIAPGKTPPPNKKKSTKEP